MIVVICGSIKTNEENIRRFMKEISESFTSSFTITPFSVPYPHTNNPEEKAANRRYYFEAISYADAIIVYNKDHIGLGTAQEIGAALVLGKEIYLTHKPTEEQIELKALLAEKKARMWGR